MKKYNIEEAKKIIKKQVENYKKKAMKIATEEELNIAYKIMSTNPDPFYSEEVFRKESALISSFRRCLILNIFEFKKYDIEDFDGLIMYTRMLFILNQLNVLQKRLECPKELGEQKLFVFLLDGKLESLVSFVQGIESLPSVFVQVLYVDANDSVFFEIKNKEYGFYCERKENNEMKKIFEMNNVIYY